MIRQASIRPLALLLALLPLAAASAGPAKAAGASASPGIAGIWINPYGAHREGNPDNPKYVRPPMPEPKLTPKYQAITEATRAVWMKSQVSNLEGLSAESIIVKRQMLCLPYGMPTEMAYNMSFDIQVAADRVTIVGELDRAVRRIWLDRPQAKLDDLDPNFYGHSVGHWEGKTLVVNTIGVKDDVYGENFMAHSDQMQIDEHIWLKEPDILYDEITITDPLALTEPFKYLVILARAPKSYEPSEFICDQYPKYIIGPDGKLTINTNALK